MKMNKMILFSIATLLVGCQADEPQPTQQQPGTLSISTSVSQFDGEPATRTNIDGTAFETKDKIKLKIVCPYSSNKEFGEYTDGGSFDGFWLLRWNGSAFENLTSTETEKYDIDGDYNPSNAPNLFTRYLAQPTPYVFTAQTWSEEQIFMTGSGTRVEQYSHVFHANQSSEAAYKASDLMWAQTIMQTGSYHVHLSFKHVMSALLITVEGLGTTDNAVLTVEGMPAIDQAEVIVGDSYAAYSKVNVAVDGKYDYSYRAKSSISSVDDNGKALGIAVIDDSQKKAYCKAFANISKNATYTAYREPGTNQFRLIVPPCEFEPVVWLRTGANLEHRYRLQIGTLSAVGGVLYTFTMKLPNS